MQNGAHFIMIPETFHMDTLEIVKESLLRDQYWGTQG